MAVSSASAEESSEEKPSSPMRWQDAPTAAGKAILLLEQTWQALDDTWSALTEVGGEVSERVSSGARTVKNKIAHKHAPLEIPYYLLPEPLPAGAQKPLTVVIDLELIFHAPPNRVQRAGLDFFLTQVSEFAEIVLVSNQPAKGVMELMQAMDPLGLIAFRLAHEHFAVHDAHMGLRERLRPARDLQRLRRDLRRVVAVTNHPERYARHPENVLHVPKHSWHLNGQDRELFALPAVLLHLAQQPDVRETLPSFDGLNVAALVATLAADERSQRKQQDDFVRAVRHVEQQ